MGKLMGGCYMKLSVCYNHILLASEQTGLSLSEVLKKVKNMGIQSVACSYEELKPYTREMKVLLKAVELEISCIYKYFDFGYEETGEAGYGLIDLAELMGAKFVLVIPGLLKEEVGIKREQAIKHMVEALRLMCDYAKDKGITVTLEDYDNVCAPYTTAKEILWFMEQVPDLKHTFDMGNYRYRGEDEIEAFELLKDYIVYVHVKDRSTAMKGEEVAKIAADGTALFSTPVGSGVIKIKEILDKLEFMGYDGTLNIEHFDAPNQLEYIEQSIRWLLKNISTNSEKNI